MTTDKQKAFWDIARMLKPGGRLLLVGIVVRDDLSEAIRSGIDHWTG